jgi:glycosyltransferase involved in cell wall biosynthesis
MARILILANNDVGLYKFRLELIKELVKNHEVFISLPNGEYVDKLTELGCEFIHTPISRRGTNPIADLRLLFKYIGILNEIVPDVVLTYTIKPNVYGGLACRILGVSYIANVTGLGTAIQNEGLIQKITLNLYKIGLKRVSCVFFQNEFNKQFFIKRKIVKKNFRLIPGSGVNLAQHKFEEFPGENEEIKFLFIGRLMKEKGIEELLQAAKRIKEFYPNVYFDLIGIIEENYNHILADLEEKEVVKYHGLQDDVHSFIKVSHATILPSYHEGTANVLLESAATGRPILSSKVPGCIETFDEGISGFGFKVKNVESLYDTIIKFLNLPYEKKRAMGIEGRKKMENEFDRKIVVESYLNEINRIIKENN